MDHWVSTQNTGHKWKKPNSYWELWTLGCAHNSYCLLHESQDLPSQKYNWSDFLGYGLLHHCFSRATQVCMHFCYKVMKEEK